MRNTAGLYTYAAVYGGNICAILHPVHLREDPQASGDSAAAGRGFGLRGVRLYTMWIEYHFFFNLAALHGMQDVSPLTRD